MLTEDYVSFETAKLLKEKGFAETSNTIGTYNDKGEFYLYKHEKGYNHNHLTSWYSAPTLQMAMKWLRDEKGIAIIPIIDSILDHEKFLWDIKIVVAKTSETFSQGWVYENPESGYDRAIRYCLENLIQ